MMQRSWRRILGVPWPDLTVAGVLVAAAIATTVTDPQVLHPLTEVVSALLAGSLVLRTRAPLIMAMIASAACICLALLPGAQTPLWSFVTILILAFSVTSQMSGIRAGVALLLLLAATVVIQLATTASTVEMLLTPAILVGAPALAGWLLGRSRAQAERLQRLSSELAAERERSTRLAAQAERARIARDLHDILAHTLSSIAVQAGAAQQLLAPAAAARTPVEHIMFAAHEALQEVRSLLSIARQSEPDDPDPRLGLDRIADLAAADGAELCVLGTPTPVQPGISLAAFRIVQEALTNARRHATGEPAAVTVTYDADTLRLEITNGAHGALPVQPVQPDRAVQPVQPVQHPGGHGLVGMAERAAAYSGAVSSGPDEAGGWTVRAVLPYRSAHGDRAAVE